MILVDIREPKHIFERLKNSGIEVKREILSIGDYILPNEIAIERKEGDIITSIQNHSIFEQLHNLKQYKNPILVITTKNLWRLFYHSKSRHIHKAYYGTLSSILLSYKIPIVFFDDVNDFIDFLIVLYKQCTAEKSTRIPIKKIKKGRTLEEEKIYLLASIRGMSYEKAKVLLEKYNSISNIARLDIKEIIKNKNIGKKTAEYILSILN